MPGFMTPGPSHFFLRERNNVHNPQPMNPSAQAWLLTTHNWWSVNPLKEHWTQQKKNALNLNPFS